MENEDFEDGRVLLSAITESLVSSIDLRGISKWQLPGKVHILRESLLWRVHELAQNAYDALDAERFVAASLSARAVMETAAAIVFLNSLVQRMVQTGVTEALVAKMNRFLINSKVWEELEDPIHVNDMLREVEQVIPGFFTKHYASLSEKSHPNWLGTFGAFGEFDKEKVIANFNSVGRSPDASRDMISINLSATLSVAQGYANILMNYYERLTEVVDTYYESNAKAADIEAPGP